MYAIQNIQSYCNRVDHEIYALVLQIGYKVIVLLFNSLLIFGLSQSIKKVAWHRILTFGTPRKVLNLIETCLSNYPYTVHYYSTANVILHSCTVLQHGKLNRSEMDLATE